MLKGENQGDCLGCEVVVLDDDVGEREIVDGTTGEPIPIDETCRIAS